MSVIPISRRVCEVSAGETPLVSASRLLRSEGLEGELLLKLEYLNPGFSKKDRIAKEMVREAKASGDLAEGQAVVRDVYL